ncbi:alpha/beta hydrolase family protein [Inhella gelatinilytica]|uniref:Alpha/beta fold hydrolase n=1 Tax=Inhella gelatinilytica TaxID=2795030 RepID=A0A931J2N6_9BURK|nr:alpha/beta fold hydrolase [Inhella gelatinilytica]MBH9554221.1 alpha/beta fold hydrolase [Inhella gelatinilytica]
MHFSAQWPAQMGSPDLAHLQAGWSEEFGGRPLVFEAADGAALRGCVFEPRQTARAVAVVAPATGVPQGYYRAFALWLASRGYAVLTFDYRGMGHSRAAPGPSLRNWVRLDLSAALAAARQRAGQGVNRLPLVWVGHSLGGNGLPLIEGLVHLDAAVTLGSQFGYWGLWPSGWRRQLTRFFFSTWIPAWVRSTGRLPGWALGGGEALPAAAALDWARWGVSPGYFLDDPECQSWYRPEDFRGQLQLWSLSDDLTYGPPEAVNALADCFQRVGAKVERFHLRPEEVGLPSLGHFGPFRRTAAERLWPLLLERLEARVPQLSGAAA